MDLINDAVPSHSTHSAAQPTNRRRHAHQHSYPLEREDFIVITEFSEREGPIAPLTVPSALPSEWNFNASKFALRVLGSEFRKKKALGSLPSIHVSDMQQCFDDDSDALYIYCYYTSIADFGARGYMRAFCLTYITPTPKKIQRIFRYLSQKFAETAMILKKAAQTTFLREIDAVIQTIENTNIPSADAEQSSSAFEYNDLFQCHLNAENRGNILIDMREIRNLFAQNLMQHSTTTTTTNNDGRRHMQRTRHRPHCVGKEGYKALKHLIERDDYCRFRDALRNIHSLFGKNCLDIYVDHYNRELQHLQPHRLFAVGSLSCLDIHACNYFSPSWKTDQCSASSSFVSSPPPVPNSSQQPSTSKTRTSKTSKKNMTSIHPSPNLFLHHHKTVRSPRNATQSKTKTQTPSQHLHGGIHAKSKHKHRNINTKFLQLYDKKMRRIYRNNSMLIRQQQTPHKHAYVNGTTAQSIRASVVDEETDDAKSTMATTSAADGAIRADEHARAWQTFILSRSKCELEVHKAIRRTRTSKTPSTSTIEHETVATASSAAVAVDATAETLKTTKTKTKTKTKRVEKRVRFRESSDKAREKNLYRCLLSRFKGFAESILFTILSNRTLVILTHDAVRNKEKVCKTVRALSLLIPCVEHLHATQEWREQPLLCEQLAELKIVGMSNDTCHASPDELWNEISIVQFDECIMYGPSYKCEDAQQSWLSQMLHPRKRLKTPDLFYRYLSRSLLQMSLHCLLFLNLSRQRSEEERDRDVNGNQDGDTYFTALLESLQFTQCSDIDIVKHWCSVMQGQLHGLQHGK